jgi:CysZ protein
MLDDAVKALTQLMSPPLRAVLWRSIGLALALIIVVAIALDRLVIWLVRIADASLKTSVGAFAQLPADVLAWVLSVAAGLGIIVGSLLLVPAATAFVAGLFSDQIAGEVERVHYPDDPAGVGVPLPRVAFEGGKTALLAVVVYICTAPFLLFAGIGAVLFFAATAWLLGRVYFELAAMRFRPPAEAKALRKRNAATVYLGGLLIAGFVSIPVANLATPLFAMGLMVHVHKRLSGRRLIAQVQ